jgi:chaperonin cofactor prefoldin
VVAMGKNNLKVLSAILLMITIVLSSFVWLSLNQSKELQNQNNTLKTQVDNLQNQNVQLQDQINVSKNRINEIENQTDTLQNQTNMLQNQNNVLQKQNDDLQDQNSKLKSQINATLALKITSFQWISGFNPYSGMTLANQVIVTVQNQFAFKISGLTVTFVLINNGTAVGHGDMRQIELLAGGETKEISSYVYYNTLPQLDGAILETTLSSGNIILDKWTYKF